MREHVTTETPCPPSAVLTDLALAALARVGITLDGLGIPLLPRLPSPQAAPEPPRRGSRRPSVKMWRPPRPARRGRPRKQDADG